MYAEALKEENEETQKAMPKFYISAAFNWLIGLTATLTLLLSALR